MPLLVAVVLGAGALAFVLYPLYRRTGLVQEQGHDSQQMEHEQAAKKALQEVEFDFQLGNIAEPEYQSLRERYMRRALSALKSRYEHEKEIDAVIEDQVRQLREGGDHDVIK